MQSKNNAATRSPVVEPPQVQQLRAKLHQDDLNIADMTKHQAQVQEQIHVLEGRVQSSPIVEQEYKELTRNYQTALDFYNNLLKNREQAAMATNLEQQQEGEQFRVLDPASLPDTSFISQEAYLSRGRRRGWLGTGAWDPFLAGCERQISAYRAGCGNLFEAPRSRSRCRCLMLHCMGIRT